MEERKNGALTEEKELSLKEKQRAAAIAYAKFLKSKGLKPGDLSPEQVLVLMQKEAALQNKEVLKPVKAEPDCINNENETDKTAKAEVVKEPSEDKKNKKSKKEKKSKNKKQGSFIARFFTAIIDFHDRIQDTCDSVIIEQTNAVIAEYHKELATYKASRKKIGNSIIAIAVICSMMMLVFEHFTYYEYAYNGRVLGYVDDQSVVTDVLDVAGEHLTQNNNIEVTFSTKDTNGEEGNITFKKVSSDGKTIDDADSVVNKLAYMTDIETTAYGIFEKGKLLTIVKSESTASRVLEYVKSVRSKPDKGMELVSSNYRYEIEIKPVSVMLASIQEETIARNLLIDGGDTNIYHIINEEEDLESIAETFGVEKSDIFNETNSAIKTEFEIGDKVCIRKKVTTPEVKLVEEGTMSEVVPYKVIKKKTDKMYKGDTVVKQEGVNGKQVITGKLTKVNGEIVKRDLTNTEVIKEVQDKIILVGTAKRPKTEPTGIFGNPLDASSGYVITSRVGPRWGSSHEGVDFGVRQGTEIHASDGGEIVIADWYGAYGMCVQIKHNDGYITRYGHCSAIKVKVGDKVYKGQTIALSGNTGRSTGPHLHFEIRKNNAVLDPGPIIGVYG